MKKIVSLICILSIAITSAFALIGCTPKEEEAEPSRVMNVSLNPEVEFVLDANDKVISVNALNEEGNLIISGQAFVGKTDEEALKLYIEICKDTGFLISGNVSAGDNQITVSFSGDDAQAAFNDIKNYVEGIFTEKGLDATISKGADLGAEYLNDLISEFAPYLEEAKVNALSYAEKLELIKESREETKDMYSEELKNFYYQVKEDAVNTERFKEIKNQVSDVFVTIAINGYNSLCTALENLQYDIFVKEDGVYQSALATMRATKQEFLNYKNYVASLENPSQTVLDELDRLEGLFDDAQEVIDSASTMVTTAFTDAKNLLDSGYNTIMNYLNTANIKVDSMLDNMSSSMTSALDTMESNFATQYASAKTAATTAWSNMKTNLIAGYQVQE